MEPPYEPHPRKLCPDPEIGTREGWRWCAQCGGIQAPGHLHGYERISEAAALRSAVEFYRLELELAESLLCALAFDHGRFLLATKMDCAGCLFCGAPR